MASGSTKIVGSNINKNSASSKNKLKSAKSCINEDILSKNVFKTSGLGNFDKIGTVLKSVLSSISSDIDSEIDYLSKYNTAITKWDSLSNKIKSAKSVNNIKKLKSLFNKSKKLIGKKATIAFYKSLGYNVTISGKTVSIVKKTKKTKNSKSKSGSSSSKSSKSSAVAKT